jgi:hypothetical protein
MIKDETTIFADYEKKYLAHKTFRFMTTLKCAYFPCCVINGNKRTAKATKKQSCQPTYEAVEQQGNITSFIRI